MISTHAPRSARCHRAADFAVRVWADGAVVYDEADASLHALNPIAGEAFSLLRAHLALTPHALASLLFRDEPQEDDVAMVEQLLSAFEHMGLIERLPA